MQTTATKPATQRLTAKVQGVHLQPVPVADADDIAAAAFDGVRRRPVLATKPDGSQVVCCSRTARKHGWTVEGRLFDRKAKHG